MGKIWKYLIISAMRTRRVHALIDTGAATSVIKPNIAQSIGLFKSFSTYLILPNQQKYRADVGSIRVVIQNRWVNTDAAVFPIKEQLILGRDFLQSNKAFIDMTKDTIKFNRFAPKFRRKTSEI